MNTVPSRSSSPWLPAVVCALFPLFCALIIRPSVQLGIIDDWSYIRSAQVLASTGHIVYNGWATAMLGWQLYLGALFIKLFGLSFTAPRLATLLIAMATAALMQRLSVRLGLRPWTAAAITLIFLASPVFLAVTFSFMSDVYGMLVLIGCSFCCIRALQTPHPRAATLWICAAALLTALGGTARQIAWIGVLVMVPCTLWLLRRNRQALLFGGASTLLGMASVPAFLAWFRHQPYSIPESVFPETAITLHSFLLEKIPYFLKYAGFELFFLTAPLLLLFLPASLRNRRARFALAAILLYWAVRLAWLHHTHNLYLWEPPYLFNSLWFSGWEVFPSYLGTPALLLTDHVRLLLTALVLTAELAFLGLLAHKPASPQSPPQVPLLFPRQLLIVFGPATLAYLLLLLPRASGLSLIDRYLLFPEFVFLVAAALLYQRKVSLRLPAAAWLFIAAYAALNTAGLHDTFNLFRAQATLLDRLQAAGIPRTQLDGGSQFNGWTEVLTTGHLNDKRMQRPGGLYRPLPVITSHDPCHTRYLELTPSIHARFVVSFNPRACGGPTGYQQTYTSWLGPRTQTLYAVQGPEEAK